MSQRTAPRRRMAHALAACLAVVVTAGCGGGDARDDSTAARRLAPDIGRMDDRAGFRPLRNAGEFDPFDVTHDSASHSPAASHV